jgi:hypothetical protein
MKQLLTIVNTAWDEGMQVACTVIVRLAIQANFGYTLLRHIHVHLWDLIAVSSMLRIT